MILTITLERGKTYEFNIDAPGHPFWIKTINSTGTGNSYSDGITNNGTTNGKITFKVPEMPLINYIIIVKSTLQMNGII